ncbi:MAG TPA: ABC transporter permease [Blastocatellia bacterium]|nr:ABC transporter permease [Blastocatellia bacterium]
MMQDLRYAMRMLAKKPGFTLIAVITLALGIGANTAIFSVVNAVLLNPMPYREPDRLIQFWETNPLKSWTQAPIAPANLFDWQQQNQSFEEIAAYMGSDKSGPGIAGLHLTGDGEPERVKALYVTGNVFSVLGVDTMLGRTLREDETWQGKHTVVVLSHALWQRRFGGDPGVIGQKISLNGRSREVVGVMAADFYFPSKEIELWVPMGWNQQQIAQLRRPHFLRAVGRLKPGVTTEQARAEITAIAGRLEEQYPETNTQMGVGLGPLKDWIVGDTKLPLMVFLVAVGFVLLIACANVANLLLARAATRNREVAIRTALGARRSRIVRQLLTESFMLALVGGGLGVLLALWSKDLLVAFSPGDIPRLEEARLDAKVLGFTIGLTLLTTFLFGLAPALQASKPDLVSTLKEGGQKGGSQGGRVRSVLVVAEVALALVLVIGAGLMIRSFLRLQQVDPGFNANNLLMLSVGLPGAKYPEDSQAITFFEQAEQRLKALPGVLEVGATNVAALKGSGYTNDMTIEGRPPEDYVREIRHKTVTPDYFRAMGIQLLSGRQFDKSDNATSSTIIVNEAFARRCFPGEDPVGKRVKFAKPTEPGTWETIVGVVRSEKQDSLGTEPKPESYKTQLQEPSSSMTLVIRTAGDPKALIGAARDQIRALDKDLPPYNVKTMDEAVYESLVRERFTTLLLIVFAGLALTLAAIGIYGVMSYAVNQRTHEIGIRVALGAQTRDIFKQVIGRAMRLAAAGIALGLAASIALTRLMASLLYGVSTTDPLTFASIAIVLLGVSLLASYIPARRATKVDAMIALRYE